MVTSPLWKKYKNKKVRLIIKDGWLVRPRDGIFKDIDDTHLFILVDGETEAKPFLRNDIKRVELKEDETN